MAGIHPRWGEALTPGLPHSRSRLPVPRLAAVEFLPMRIRSLMIAGAAGAAAAYFLDPEHGAARRARLQDQAQGLALELRDRARSALASLDTPLAPRPDDDLSLLSRVERALLGLPQVGRGSVETEVIDGHVVLHGEVASVEQEREVVEAAGSVPGVAGVESQLHLAGQAG